eukprot:CAMPEP_0171832440 /NCGR_PEP_ID=MMETSP0992-20121227/9338_1 /TAXON_ID=483369 /ORGANISM="non described non described, Strain CCMP2098" /LENGTH=205 /DNA_ID=CAMNT_0012447971 /DNA_START=183 /DNA_END=801 /DNA_ORIENTATION=+
MIKQQAEKKSARAVASKDQENEDADINPAEEGWRTWVEEPYNKERGAGRTNNVISSKTSSRSADLIDLPFGMTTGKTVLTSTAGWGTPRQSRRLRRRAIAWHSDKLTAPTRASTTNSLMVSDEAHQELAALPQLEGQEDCFAVFKAIQHVRKDRTRRHWWTTRVGAPREDKFMDIRSSTTVNQLCVQKKRTWTPASGIPVQKKRT